MASAARVGLLLGDPCGIGPELVAKLVAGRAKLHSLLRGGYEGEDSDKALFHGSLR
jgi:4-hydroxy-L-threonine phosphate dehydrogenase PdxA